MKVYRSTAVVLMASTIVFMVPVTGQTGGLTCSSDDGEYHYCRADTRNQL